MSSISDVKCEQHFCSRIKSNVVIEKTYQSLPRQSILVTGRISCQSAGHCVDSDCKYVVGEFGKDYLT